MRVSSLDWSLSRARRIRNIGAAAISASVIAFWGYTQWLRPAPFYISYDPELPYMMNSLAAFKGHSYTYNDHPGTPVEVLGSLIFAATYPLARLARQPFVAYHLQNPWVFLVAARTLLTALTVLCLLLVAKHAIPLRHWSDAVASIGVVGIYFAVHPYAFLSTIWWSHNSLNLPFGTLYLLMALVVLRSKSGPGFTQFVGLGVGVGLLTAIQLYFAAWIVGAVITAVVFLRLSHRAHESVRAAAAVALGSGLGFLIATLPIVGKYPAFFQWIGQLITHQGLYGSGPRGLPSFDQLSTNLSTLMRQLPELSAVGLVTIILVGVLLWFRRRDRDVAAGPAALAIGLIAQLLLTTLMIAKHPGVMYALSLAATLPILWSALFALFPLGNDRMLRSRSAVAIMLTSLVAVGLVRNMNTAVTSRNAQVLGLEAEQLEVNRALGKYEAQSGTNDQPLVILSTYGTNSRCYSLNFGNGYAGSVFTEELTAICPSEYELNIWNAQIRAEGTWHPISEYRWDLIVSREVIVQDYPFLLELGELSTLPVEVAQYSNGYGDIVLIKNDKQ